MRFFCFGVSWSSGISPFLRYTCPQAHAVTWVRTYARHTAYALRWLLGRVCHDAHVHCVLPNKPIRSVRSPLPVVGAALECAQLAGERDEERLVGFTTVTMVHERTSAMVAYMSPCCVGETKHCSAQVCGVPEEPPAKDQPKRVNADKRTQNL